MSETKADCLHNRNPLWKFPSPTLRMTISERQVLFNIFASHFLPHTFPPWASVDQNTSKSMLFLHTEPSKTNMHTCKDEPFRTTPTSVLLMKPMNSLSYLCTGFLGVWRLSAQNFGRQTDLGTHSFDVRGLSSVDVRGIMPGQPAENPSV
jgi:hypothetical protein